MAVFIRTAINANKLNHIIQQFNISDWQIKDFCIEELHRIFALKQDYQRINEQIYRLRQEGINYLKDTLQLCQLG
jgi:deoxyhypusine synthase